MPELVHRHHERGASSVEYALLAALIALVILGAVTLFGSEVNNLFSDSCDSLPPAGNC